MKSTGYSSPRSRLAVYLVAGNSFGVMVRRVRFLEFEMVTFAMETRHRSVQGSIAIAKATLTSRLVP